MDRLFLVKKKITILFRAVYLNLASLFNWEKYILLQFRNFFCIFLLISAVGDKAEPRTALSQTEPISTAVGVNHALLTINSLMKAYI